MEPLDDGVTVAEVTRSDGLTAPAIFVGPGGSVAVLREPLAFAFREIERSRPFYSVSRIIRTLARFIDFYIANGRREATPGNFRALVEDYLLYREGGDSEKGLSPLSRAGLESELAHLSYFSDFCERQYGYFPIVSQHCHYPASREPTRAIYRLLACSQTELFSHLAIRRAEKRAAVTIPGRRNRKSGSDGYIGMTEAFAWDMVQAERNITFKSIWLLGFFAGPRVSEILNLWSCDVMPGDFRKYWFPGDPFTHLPLVVIANPWDSNWCGSVGDEGWTRGRFLQANYGLSPRPEMTATEGGEFRGRASGFKGSKPTHKKALMRQLFWASEDAAGLFEATVVKVFAQRRLFSQARAHPFLFVNSDRRKPELAGNMTTLSNVRKAFERAVRRVGGTPYTWKQRPHGMRHLYKDLVKKLTGDDLSAVQSCMGHWSRDSQDDYGSLDLMALKHALASKPRMDSLK